MSYSQRSIPKYDVNCSCWDLEVLEITFMSVQLMLLGYTFTFRSGFKYSSYLKDIEQGYIPYDIKHFSTDFLMCTVHVTIKQS